MYAIRALAFCAALLGSCGAVLGANLWNAGAFVFSDELGGFEILSVTGTGTEADPVVIEQRLTQIGPAIIVVRPESGQQGFSPELGANPFMQLALVSVITNDSRRVWSGFDIELQENLGQPSVYRDGLSFDQLHTFDEREFSSNRFAVLTDHIEPYDRIRFEQGKVDHGETAEFRVFITDVTPRAEFYLLQEPQLLMAGIPANRLLRLARAQSTGRQ